MQVVVVFFFCSLPAALNLIIKKKSVMHVFLDYIMDLKLYTTEFFMLVTHFLERVKVQNLMADLTLLNLYPC